MLVALGVGLVGTAWVSFGGENERDQAMIIAWSLSFSPPKLTHAVPTKPTPSATNIAKIDPHALYLENGIRTDKVSRSMSFM